MEKSTAQWVEKIEEKVGPEAVPVIIRGVLYPSMKSAARRLGVSVQAVSSAADRGTLDNVGLGQKKFIAKPVVEYGVIYPSITAYAKAAGICMKTAQQRLKSARHPARRLYPEPDTPSGT